MKNPARNSIAQETRMKAATGVLLSAPSLVAFERSFDAPPLPDRHICL